MRCLPVAKTEEARKPALNAANKIHYVADTAGQGAKTLRDSLSMWHTRDSLHVVENDSLRSVIRSDSLQKSLLASKAEGWRVLAHGGIPLPTACPGVTVGMASPSHESGRADHAAVVTQPFRRRPAVLHRH